ncbi:hypothetical protein KIL84_005131 [Mauremys mutica]|uniref:Uncharacterized protein n=1 Tax=Mauremys mutica TaxID=74926 RepID=A0A9D3XLM9_9SAUR|nr:hypothetical protein KIL84_005131 [Mauremys mutica]
MLASRSAQLSPTRSLALAWVHGAGPRTLAVSPVWRSRLPCALMITAAQSCLSGLGHALPVPCLLAGPRFGTALVSSQRQPPLPELNTSWSLGGSRRLSCVPGRASSG